MMPAQDILHLFSMNACQGTWSAVASELGPRAGQDYPQQKWARAQEMHEAAQCVGDQQYTVPLGWMGDRGSYHLKIARELS